MEYICRYASPLGSITMSGSGAALTGLWFDGQRFFAQTLEQDYREANIPVFDHARRWLDLYFSGTAPDFTPELSLKGTEFRKAVWNQLLTIPYGKTATYGQLAEQIKAQHGLDRMSPRAVGGAVGRNPISLIIPCHRVIGSDGSLTGYAGGIDRKRWLLDLEQSTCQL